MLDIDLTKCLGFSRATAAFRAWIKGSGLEVAIGELLEIFFKDVTGCLPGGIWVEDLGDETLLGFLVFFIGSLLGALAFPPSRRGVRGIELRGNPSMYELCPARKRIGKCASTTEKQWNSFGPTSIKSKYHSQIVSQMKMFAAKMFNAPRLMSNAL